MIPKYDTKTGFMVGYRWDKIKGYPFVIIRFFLIPKGDIWWDNDGTSFL